jgi:hypothetical protein
MREVDDLTARLRSCRSAGLMRCRPQLPKSLAVRGTQGRGKEHKGEYHEDL